ncbi:DUF4179 domain-containing protein [Alkaliphilus transvaalensis]|uniref:DUF4179 domain-containing protein n=1 Tax=Alkaliphilus transvaalensis TaxID=114628 RepID=UPI00047D2E74|nr:DUF4179 domain-containing protein [Alkaliphilus transvaalensis]
MKKVEELLLDRKKQIEAMEVPLELEDRLTTVLKNKGRKNKKILNRKWLQVAAILLIVFMVSYNFNTLAYYSKKLLGYDNVMNGTLKELNELGRGQVIGESYTFENGITITLDGVMMDEGQLLAFFTVKEPSGALEASEYPSQMHLKGLTRNYRMLYGQGEIIEGENEIKWLMAFEAPRFYEKSLQFKTSLKLEDHWEEASINFTIDRSKAMKPSLKKNINKTFQVEYTTIKVESIVASPTQTIINGRLQSIFQLAKDQMLGERMRPNQVNIKLLANGKEVHNFGAGLTTDLNGMTFENRFDALPTDLHTLEIHLESFSVDRDVEGEVELNKNQDNSNIEVLGKEIKIDGVLEENGNTYVTITTAEDIVLTKVYLIIDGSRVNLKETVAVGYDKLQDGSIVHTRTLNFPSTGEKLQLNIERMSFTEDYNQIIKIPVE